MFNENAFSKAAINILSPGQGFPNIKQPNNMNPSPQKNRIPQLRKEEYREILEGQIYEKKMQKMMEKEKERKFEEVLSKQDFLKRNANFK